MQIPPSLVLGCNTPHGIGVLSDWIQEQTGFAPDFTATGWSDSSQPRYSDCSGSDSDDGRNYGNGEGDGTGSGYDGISGLADGSGTGCGAGLNYGFAHGDGVGSMNHNGPYIAFDPAFSASRLVIRLPDFR